MGRNHVALPALVRHAGAIEAGLAALQGLHLLIIAMDPEEQDLELIGSIINGNLTSP